MDSRPRRLPFTVSSSSSSSPSSSSSSAASLRPSRLYGSSSIPSRDSYTHAKNLKLDGDYKSSWLQLPSRDYTPSDVRPSWKTPSTTRDAPWSQSSLSSRSKLTESERRLGTYSGLVGSADDGDTKRAKLSYMSRTSSYTRSPSSSLSGSSSLSSSSYCSPSTLTSTSDSSWRTYRPLSSTSHTSSSTSSSSEALRSWRERERADGGLKETSYRSSSLGLGSSLYRPDRLSSSYAQGARPKEPLYSSPSVREGSALSRHLSSAYQPSPPAREPRPPARSLSSTSSSSSSSTSSSSTLRSSLQKVKEEQPPTPAVSSSSSWYSRASSPPPPASSPPPPRPAPEGGDSDGRRSTRRLLSRLFSRRSSQDTAPPPLPTTPPPAPPLLPSSPPPAPPSLPHSSSSTETAQAFAFLRRSCQGLSPAQERVPPRGGASQPSQEAWRSGSEGPGAAPSWLRSRCTPLFSRHRREGRDESALLASSSTEEGLRGAQYPTRRRVEFEPNPEEEDEDEEEDGEGVGEVMAASAALQEELRVAGRSQRLARVMSSPLTLRGMMAIDMMGVARSQPEGQEKDKPAPSRDPEKLRQIQESLLLEDSDEEEGDLCRICQMKEESPVNPLMVPCRCTGSLQFVHQDCIKQWLRSKISSGSDLEAITTCELCKNKLQLNIENFDINELYRTHGRSEYEFISCGLYLVVLLHLCEQRFSDVLGAANDAGFFNLARTLHEHMDNLESSYSDSDEEEAQDTRPSIDFCDLDDDLED